MSRCTYIFSKGVMKNTQCETIVPGNGKRCSKHSDHTLEKKRNYSNSIAVKSRNRTKKNEATRIDEQDLFNRIKAHRQNAKDVSIKAYIASAKRICKIVFGIDYLSLACFRDYDAIEKCLLEDSVLAPCPQYSPPMHAARRRSACSYG